MKRTLKQTTPPAPVAPLSIEAVSLALRDLAPSFLYSTTPAGDVLIESKQSEGRRIVEDCAGAVRMLRSAGFDPFSTAPTVYVSRAGAR